MVGKTPPLAGGVSTLTLRTAVQLACEGWFVDLLTDAESGTVDLAHIVRPSIFRNLVTSGHLTVRGVSDKSDTNRLRTLLHKAIEVCGSRRYDLVLGWYLFPYGEVAASAGAAMGVPSLLVHAGSDIYLHTLGSSYRERAALAFNNCTSVLTPSGNTRQRLWELGCPPSKIVSLTSGFSLPWYHRETCACHSAQRILADAQEVSKRYGHEARMRLGNRTSEAVLRSPIVVFYGKVSPAKKFDHLLDVLQRLAARGIAFSVLAALGGSEDAVEKMFARVRESEHLAERTFLTGPLLPWEMPPLLRLADVGLCIEEEFPVVAHNPIIPREMLAAGLAVVVSHEIAEKPFYRWILRDGMNCCVVNDASGRSLEKMLARLLQNSDLRERLRNASRVTSDSVESALGHTNGVIEAIPSVAHI